MEIGLVILGIIFIVYCVHEKGKTRAGYLGYYWDITYYKGRKKHETITVQTVDARTYMVRQCQNMDCFLIEESIFDSSLKELFVGETSEGWGQFKESVALLDGWAPKEGNHAPDLIHHYAECKAEKGCKIRSIEYSGWEAVSPERVYLG